MNGLIFRTIRVQIKLFIPFCCYLQECSGFVLKRHLFRHSKIPPVIYSNVKCNFAIFNGVYKNKVVNSLVSIRSMSTNSQLKTCWNCGKVPNTYTVFCDSCNTLQPVDKNADFFQIMGVSRSYKTVYSELRLKYRILQTLLHPDKFSSKPKKEQELSEEFSAIVNKAYSTLLDPLERGLYLLSLHKVAIEEGTTDIDKVFLMEIMERNEEIENETDPLKLKELNTVNKEQLNSLVGKVAQAFETNDIELAKKLLTKMKYYHSIETKIKEIKQKLNIPD